MMLQLDHERNLKLDAFERVEDLQRQVKLLTLPIKILSYLNLIHSFSIGSTDLVQTIHIISEIYKMALEGRD